MPSTLPRLAPFPKPVRYVCFRHGFLVDPPRVPKAVDLYKSEKRSQNSNHGEGKSASRTESVSVLLSAKPKQYKTDQ